MSRFFAMFALILGLSAFGFPPYACSSEQQDVLPPSADAPSLEKNSNIVRLANGLTVLVRADRRFPVVSTRLYVHAGSAYEKPEWAGISHLIEHMAFKGTARRPKGEISREIEAAGGYLNAATSFDYTVYINDLPARHWKLGMDVAADLAFQAAMDPAELEAEREVVIAELARGNDNPHSELFQALHGSVLADTPYSRPIIGYEKTLRAITAEEIRAYLRDYYQPRNMLLTVVGDVNPAEVLAEAERIFGSYENTGSLAENTPIDAARLCVGTPAVSVRPGPWNKVYFALGIPVPGSGDYNSLSLDMLAALLGGDSTALLPRTYKFERQLVDSISVENVSFERVGMLVVEAQLDAGKVQEFWDSLVHDLASLKASLFTPREIDRVRLNLEEGVLKTRETIAGLASHLGYVQFFLGGEQGESNILKALRSVDEKVLQRAIDDWIAPRHFSAVMLSPAAASVNEKQLERTLEAAWPAPKLPDMAAGSAIGQTEIVELGQGRKVVLIPDDSMPHLALSLFFSGGESLLAPSSQGLSSLTARALPSGTQARSRGALDAYITDRAGEIFAASGRLDFTMNLRAPSRFSGELLALFKEIINHPAFDPAEVAREKNAQIAAIKTTEDAPLGLLFRRLPPFLFPGSIFGYQTQGTAQSLAAFTPEMVREFWEKQRSCPWVLAVSGSFDRAEILKFAENLPIPETQKAAVSAPNWTKQSSLSLKLPNRKQAHLLLLFPTAPRSSLDTPGLILLEEALGGMGGPLFGQLRDEMGLGYTVDVFNVQNNAVGYMAFYIGTEPERLDEAKAEFLKIIYGLHKKMLSAADLTRGLNHWEGEYYRELQSLSARASEAAKLTLEELPLDENRRRIEAARSITPQDIQLIAEKYLKPGAGYTITVMPDALPPVKEDEHPQQS